MKKIKNWMDSHYLKGRISNPNIEVEEFTYYSGYYHEKEFEDQCVRYLLRDGSTKNYREIFGEELEFDKLRIGRFCSIGSGAVIGSRALVAKDVEPHSIVGGQSGKGDKEEVYRQRDIDAP